MLKYLNASTSYVHQTAKECDSDAKVTRSCYAGEPDSIQPVKVDSRRRKWVWDDRVMPEPNTGCHLWMGPLCRLGYGRIRPQGVGPNPSPVLVHRVAWERVHGPIPSGVVVCHRCDVPSCVNPDHLFLGSQKDNLRDMFAKGRARPRGVAPRGFLTADERRSA